MRSELFGEQRFAEHGASLAQAHEVLPLARGAGGEGSALFFPRLADNLQAVRRAARGLAEAAEAGRELTPAAWWLLDNQHLLEEQLATVREGLPRSFFSRLPVLADEHLAGLPRIYGVAWAWVAHTDAGHDLALLRAFLRGYQLERELSLAELWALPTTWRVVLLENLRRIADRLAAEQAAEELALTLAAREDAAAAAGDAAARWPAVQASGAGPAFLSTVWLHTQARAGNNEAWVHWLAGTLPDPGSVQQAWQAERAADLQSIRNTITSLREAARLDWPALVADVSPTVQTLLRNPCFAAEHPQTQTQTLHAVERLARRSARSERQVAELLVQQAAAAGGAAANDMHEATLRWWWCGGGENTTRRQLGLQPRRWPRRGTPAFARRVTPPYLLLMVLATLGAIAALMGLARVDVAWPLWLVTALLAAGPVSEAVVAVVNRLISESVPPTLLPRLALREGIPREHATLVVMPVMLTSASNVRTLLAQLEQHAVANRERHAQFALLSDWADADTATLPTDAALLQAAHEGVQRLNERHGRAALGPRFLLLHRARQWCESEQRFIGWERKRGKLEQLIALLAEPTAPSPFIPLGEASTVARGIQHLLTLDADTDLPPGRLRALVAVAAHPMVLPRLTADGRGIEAGHALLQPRVEAPLPPPGTTTLFHALFNGQGGLDPYSAASSEVYQDVFGEGSFSGKGLIHVHAAHRVLGGRLPQDQVLSHDLLEGNLLRCAAVSDLSLVEDAPAHPDVHHSRVHRWTRGDWQLLPLMFSGSLPLAPIHRWKMLDNLRRSLVAPLSLGFLLWVLASGVLPLPLALAVVLAASAAGPLIGAVAALAPSRDDISLPLFYRAAGADLLRAAGGALWHLVTLLPLALLQLDAIGRALWRQFVSHRLLLQWTTAAAAEAAARRDLPGLLRQHRRAPVAALVLALVLGAAAALGAPVQGAAAAVLLLVWAAAGLWTALALRAPPPPLAPTARPAAAQALPPEQLGELKTLAAQIWAWFSRHVNAAERHLPPDNVQLVPYPMVAHRTSPTNIGLYLVAVLTAQRLGLVDAGEARERIDATLSSVEQLPTHAGHLFNWIDTERGRVLPPAYVSTVDSGNFCALALVLAQACQEKGWLQLAERARTLALRADFSLLYDRQARLLHIGLNADTGKLDTGHYDLLASEARLTSLVAIAKGDVPAEHWAALARPAFSRGQHVGLRSWSGSMFEYLLPTLVLAEPEGSLLHQAARAAVQEQQRHGSPAAAGHAGAAAWGVSESAIAAQDHSYAYQYGPQGVPALALRRTDADEQVLAPYAALLALPLVPRAALASLHAFERLGARGEGGFFEAVDFTPRRQAGGGGWTVVKTHMAHHQGMGLLALAAALEPGWFNALALREPHLRAVAMLLHERAPREVAPLAGPVQVAAQRARRVRSPEEAFPVHDSQPLQAALPATQWLGNGRHGLVIDSRGAGHSQHAGQGLTRQRADSLQPHDGAWLYLRRHIRQDQGDEGPIHSLTALPAADPQARYHARLQPDRALFQARWADLRAITTVWCSAEDDGELRQVELENLGPEPMRLSLWLALEPTLTPAAADAAHPAFSNLFLRARWHPQQQALLMQRRPRLGDEAGLAAVLGLVAAHSGNATEAAGAAPLDAQTLLATERQRWWGRHGSAASPLAHSEPASNGDQPVECETGGDPIAAVGARFTLAPGARATLCWLVSAAQGSAHEAGALLLARVDAQRLAAHRERSAAIAHTSAAVRLHEQGFDAPTWQALLLLQTLLGPAWRREAGAASPDTAARFDRRSLWRHGLGGDRPLLLMEIATTHGIPLVRQLVRWLSAASAAGQGVDLVVINTEPASYLAPVQQALASLTAPLAAPLAERADNGHARGRAIVLRHAELGADERHTLALLARVRLVADGRLLQEQLQALQQPLQRRRTLMASLAPVPVLMPAPAAPDAAEPRVAFEADDGAARFVLDLQHRAPMPWINVLANPHFGCHVTEMGAGHTWALNSRQHAITRWANDPVADSASEWLLLQDEASGRCWPLGRWLAADAPREVTHAPGFTRMRQQLADVEVTLTWCVDRTAPLRQTQVALRSMARSGAPALRLRVVAIVPWQLGENAAARVSVACGELALSGGAPRTVAAVQATQTDSASANGAAWLALGTDAAASSAEWSCDRREFHDAQGRLVLPARLARSSGAGLDPCGAVGLRLVLPAGELIEATLWLGHAGSASSAAQDAAAALRVNPHQRLREQRQAWQAFTQPVRVATPDASFDALFNHWLPYQATACRLWARAGYYQAGGAFGFRDQLQDAMAMAWLDPTLLEQQLLRNAARQFREGDVQHWWHEPGGAGVRTRFSDDRLWLPLGLALHQRLTGRSALLEEPVPFLEGGAVPPHAEDLYETPAPTAETATLYEHAARAIDASLTHGSNGLPLIGTGDWNDGMNRVGHEGRGESVWLAWFSIAVIDAMQPLATARGEHTRVQAWRAARERWQQALEAAGWDGQWYRRAFFDDGSPLGSSANAEARIDLIAQAWAVLAASGDPSRAETAMDSAARELWQPEAGVLRLLHPPLARQRPAAGYIQAYPPGVRENGGQYNHGAVWAVMAATRLHHRCREQNRVADAERWRERAWSWFRAISPAHRHLQQRGDEHGGYGGEPWAVAGDVQGSGRGAGRCGWSWYTGAAGWAWRAALQSLLGLHISARGLSVLPCLPPGWRFVDVTLQRPDGTRRLRIVADAAALAEALAAPGCAGRLEGVFGAAEPLPWAAVPVVQGTSFWCVGAGDRAPGVSANTYPGLSASPTDRGPRREHHVHHRI